MNRLGLKGWACSATATYSVFITEKNSSHCRTSTFNCWLRERRPLCQGGGLRDLRFKFHRVCCGDRNKSITYKQQDREMNTLGLNRWACSATTTYSAFIAEKNSSHCRTWTYVQLLTGRNAYHSDKGDAWGIYGSNPIEQTWTWLWKLSTVYTQSTFLWTITLCIHNIMVLKPKLIVTLIDLFWCILISTWTWLWKLSTVYITCSPHFHYSLSYLTHIISQWNV